MTKLRKDAPDVCSEDSPDYDAEACAKLRDADDPCDETSDAYDEDECAKLRAERAAAKTSDSVRLVDTATIDKGSLRSTADGYLVAHARVARTGIQVYAGDEVGDPRAQVRVYRPEKTVFDQQSLRTYAHKPVTLGHPPEMVNADNWRDYAVGHVDGEIMRDGGMIRVPMMITDAAAIKAIQNGANQLSVGYDARLEMVDGFNDAGEAFDAIQHDIRVNHIALTPSARGGPQLRLGDNGKDKAMERESMTTRTITIDGIELKLADQTAAIVQAGMKKLRDANAALTTERDTLSGTVAALQKQVKDSTFTDTDLDKRVADRQQLVGKAQLVLGKDWQPDGKTASDIRRAVVAKQLGDDATKAMTDAAIDGAFIAVTATTTQQDGSRELAHALARPGSGGGTPQANVEKAWEARGEQLREAWKGNGATRQ